MDKLVEHYGVVLGESTIARITEGHAKRIFETAPPAQDWPTQEGTSTAIIVQTDGGMVPIVDIDANQGDKRKGKTLRWQEAKICLVHPQDSYLVDFFHACDYLSAAGKAIVSSEQEQKIWMDEQKVRLKTNQADEVLQALRTHLELPVVPDSEAPVRQCHRYLFNRRDQLNYQGAIKRELPIGSGEIESAHRYIVQQRMKRTGAWWCPHNAEHMLALRLNRASRQWDSYWHPISDKQHDQITTSV
ncbi:MAG TPA: hypothetical protein PK372_07165 [Rugosibacter sp.]|nr:hypothetical protein [Rugosibacter sp.]HQN47340.1 hypothetical protein [Rugosibacter sp.]HQQ35688.1 hypothetical protein [Rugosibacter sp.]